MTWDKYRGKYHHGWDEVRVQRHARQVAAGIIPERTPLPDRNHKNGAGVLAWESLPEETRDLYARYMEVYAAMVDNVDQNLGRLLELLEQLGERENTIVVFTSDNGGTGEGGPEGTRSYFSRFNHTPGLPADWQPDVERDPDLIGGPQAMVHYPQGWGMASNTPFRFYKGQTYAGGVRVPLILSWPQGLQTPAQESAIRPAEQELAKPVTLLPGTPKLERYRSSKLIALRNFTIDIDVTFESGNQGVLVSHGDQGGGYSAYIEDGQINFALNEYGRLHVINGGGLTQGRQRIQVSAITGEDFRVTYVLLVNGAKRAALEDVWALVGMAPFSGIDVGVNRGGPVHWDLYERHGSFRYTGDLHGVHYEPGDRAAFDPLVLAELELEVALTYD